MPRHRGYDVRMYVAREAHLERNLAGDDFFEQRRIFREPGPMPDALGADLVQGLMNRLRPVAFAGMARTSHALRGRVLECRAVIACGVSALRSGEVEGRHTGTVI